MTVKNLAAASAIQVDWLDIFIRIFGDLPELWNPVPSSTYPPSGTSNPGCPKNGNDMHTSTSNTGSFRTPQTIPSSMLDLPSSNGLGVGSTGPSSMCSGGVGSLQPFLHPSISDPTPAAYQGHVPIHPSPIVPRVRSRCIPRRHWWVALPFEPVLRSGQPGYAH